MIFNMTGGGASLNFKVKTYPSEAELKADKPKENTIGVITTTTMTSWAFLAKEPTEPEVGMVWFSYDYSSNAEFNALKKNTLQVYPISAKQYVGGKMEDKVAYSYQNGEWFVWWNGELFDNGKQYETVTDGWSDEGYSFYESKYSRVAPTITDKITVKNTEQLQMCCAGTKNKIDLSKYSTISLTVDSLSGDWFTLAVVANKESYDQSSNRLAHVNITATGENELDISGVNGSYYVVIYRKATEGGKATTAVVSKIKLKE